MNRGIYTLANDVVYDQLVAFLNSVETNAGEDIPVCIIPYDNNLKLVKQEVALRKNVSLFDGQDSIARWEDFAKEIWAAHPVAGKSKEKKWWHESHTIRKLCSFDGRFDSFVYCDADSLVMKSFSDIFEKLESYDLVFNDWEFAKPEHDALLQVAKVAAAEQCEPSKISRGLHGSYLFAGKKGCFDDLELFKASLIKQKEIEWIPDARFWDEVPLFCYLTFKAHKKCFNFAQSPDGQERTGSDAKADPFVNVNYVLYNREGLKPIHRIHYMGYSAALFKRLCEGEDVLLPQRDVFLHYRFLKEPEKMPKVLKKAGLITRVNRAFQKIVSKMKRYGFTA